MLPTMKNLYKPLLLTLTMLAFVPALTLLFSFDFRKEPAHVPLVFDLGMLCGQMHNDTTKKARGHADCHAPVTSYVDKLPPPALMPGVGISHLPITTRSDSAQKYFDQGVSLLHDFWDFEAYRAFKYASQLDTNAAMAYWGVALALSYNDGREKEAKQAIAKAKKLSAKASEPEKLYIQALAASDSVGQEKAGEAFKAGMEKLMHQYPNDVEAKLILWLHGLDGGYSPEGAPNTHALYAQYMLEKLLVTHPDHPAVHHYWIHQMENCCPEQALASADRLAALTPQSGHMVHMPGHIYYRLGDYAKARASFIASMKVDSAYMVKQQIQQLDNWNYQHNLHYLMANCTEEGRYREAVNWHQRLEDIPPPVDSISDRMKDYRRTVFTRLVMFGADLDIRFGNWEKVVQRYSRLSDNDSMFTARPYSKTYKNALIHYARGMQAIENRKYDQARQHADALDAMLWRTVKQEKVSISNFIENRLNLQSLELRGNLLSVSGEHQKAQELLKQAQQLEKGLGYKEPPFYARPVAESIAQAYLLAKEYGKARETYQAMLKARPNSGFALFGIARTYELEGNTMEATAYYGQFAQAWKNADRNLAQVKKADAWLRSHKPTTLQVKK
jgi:tetratricopeptide (TPR) repeat protein